jgi:hypothetical protein
MTNTQNDLEAELLTKDIRDLTRIIDWMVEQEVPAKAISEAREMQAILITARDRHLAA